MRGEVSRACRRSVYGLIGSIRFVNSPTTETQALDEYLHPTPPRASSFVPALRDSRRAAGRDADTGVVENEPATGNWLGAIGYLLLLDQIGSAVEPASVGNRPGTSILRALQWWAPGTTESGRKAIYALRCALAHDYSLFNRNAKDPDMQHEFRLHRGTGQLLQLPAHPWQGNYTGLQDATTVSLRVLGDRVEQVVYEVVAAHARGDLRVSRDLTPDELLQRYSLFVSP